MTKYKVLQDNQEKVGGWSFAVNDWCSGTRVSSLETADYCLEGLEHVCLLERKRTWAELAQNLFQDRFVRELERLSKVDYPFVIGEFPFSGIHQYPLNSGVPLFLQKKIKLRGPALLMRLNELYLAFPRVRWQFCDTAAGAKLFASSLFKRLIEKRSKDQESDLV